MCLPNPKGMRRSKLIQFVWQAAAHAKRWQQQLQQQQQRPNTNSDIYELFDAASRLVEHAQTTLIATMWR